MSFSNSRHETLVPAPEDLSENFQAAEALAEWAGIDYEADGWQAFKALLWPLVRERPQTWAHSQRVTTYSLGIASMEEIAGVEDWKDKRLLGYGGLSHDIGKLKVPEEIIETNRQFSKSERAANMPVIQRHVREGFEMLVRAGFPFTAGVESGHHGYQAEAYTVPLSELPLELTDGDVTHIEKATRVIAMADHFDRMITIHDNSMTADERRRALVKDFSLPNDIARIDWLEVNQIA
jgi:response regulator RpfG family c-di-GMP phosphodiesterase